PSPCGGAHLHHGPRFDVDSHYKSSDYDTFCSRGSARVWLVRMRPAMVALPETWGLRRARLSKYRPPGPGLTTLATRTLAGRCGDEARSCCSSLGSLATRQRLFLSSVCDRVRAGHPSFLPFVEPVSRMW